MTLLVSHEETELLKTNLAYHFDRGVDFVVATENRATPGNVVVLEDYAARGKLCLLHEPAEDYAQEDWVTRMAQLAATDFEADWVVNSDVDEFLWPEVGRVKDIFAAIPPEYGTLHMHRTDFVPRPDETGFFADRMTVRRSVSLLSNGRPSRPKVAHRALGDIRVGRGSHDVIDVAGEGLAPVPGWHPLTLFHFPLRSYSQFEQKVMNLATSLPRNPRFRTGEFTERDSRIRMQQLQEGRLVDAYEEEVVNDEELALGVSAGHLVRDERLKLYLAGMDAGAGQEASEPLLPSTVLRSQEELRADLRRAVYEFEHHPREKGLRRAEKHAVRAEQRLLTAEGRLRRAERRAAKRIRKLERRLAEIEGSRWWRLGQSLRRTPPR